MRRLKVGGTTKKALILFICCFVLVALLLTITQRTHKHILTGLLIDLELSEPDPARYPELRDAITRRLPAEVPELKAAHVTLDYVHYSATTRDLLTSDSVDFIVLSPQSTPWYSYRGDAGRKLDLFKADIRDLIRTKETPVLGVCGGHQFLALAFGGSVDFIDSHYQGKYPEQYPKEAIAERGAVLLHTLQDDPIFKGVAPFPGSFYVMESHYEEVKSVPEPFVNLARSDMSEAQLMRIPGLAVYGTAFHPERGWDRTGGADPNLLSGKHILANFIGMVLQRKQGNQLH